MPRTIRGFKPSVDLVEDPATTVNVFEEKQNISGEENQMEYKDLTQELVLAHRKDIHESILAAGAKSRDAEVAALQAENKKLKGDLDALQVKDAMESKKTKARELVDKSGMPKEAITDVFMAKLIDCQESKEKPLEKQMQELIDDRMVAINAQKGGVKNATERHEDKEKKGEQKEITKEEFARKLTT